MSSGTPLSIQRRIHNGESLRQVISVALGLNLNNKILLLGSKVVEKL